MCNRADRKLSSTRLPGAGGEGGLPSWHKTEQRKDEAAKVHQFF